MSAALPLLAATYAVAAGACVLAAVAILRRAPPSSGRGARRAFLLWWTAGGALCAAQAVEAALLAQGSLDAEAARTFAVVRMALVAAALSGLLYYVGFVATGATWPALPIAVAAVAYALVAREALVAAPAEGLANDRLMGLILRGDLGVSGAVLGAFLLAVPVAGVAWLYATTRRASPGPTRRRGTLLALGIGFGAVGELFGGLGWIGTLGLETLGVAFAAVAISWAYGRAALWGSRAQEAP